MGVPTLLGVPTLDRGSTYLGGGYLTWQWGTYPRQKEYLPWWGVPTLGERGVPTLGGRGVPTLGGGTCPRQGVPNLDRGPTWQGGTYLL